MALEARIAEIEEEFSRLIEEKKEEIIKLEDERNTRIAEARKESETANLVAIRDRINAGDFANEIIPEVTRNMAATLLQHHDVKDVKESLLALHKLPVKKKSQKEKKRDAKAAGKLSFAEIAATTSAIEPFREVKKKDRSITKLPKFDPEVVPTTINATVQTDGFEVQIGDSTYELRGRLGFDAIAYLNKDKYSIRGVKITEIKRALLETNPTKFTRLIKNMNTPNLVREKLMYALLCAVLQYFVEKDLIPAGDDATDSKFTVIVERSHNVTVQYGQDIYNINDVCYLENIDNGIPNLLEGGTKHGMDEATMSALTAFIHRWANYCAIDYGFDKSN